MTLFLLTKHFKRALQLYFPRATNILDQALYTPYTQYYYIIIYNILFLFTQYM